MRTMRNGIAMTLDDHMDEKEDEEDEEDSETTEAVQRDTVTTSEIMLWSTETYLGAMADQFGTKMRAYAALREELEGIDGMACEESWTQALLHSSAWRATQVCSVIVDAAATPPRLLCSTADRASSFIKFDETVFY